MQISIYLLTIKGKDVLVAKTTLTTAWHACPGVAALVYTKDVLVSEIVGVKGVQTKPRKVVRRVGEVLKLLLTHCADAAKTAQKVTRNSPRVSTGEGNPGALV